VDLVLQASDGSLVIVDWKRTAHLSGKYQNAYQNLKEPLSHLPDCSGIHYRLQLNCYRYLIQKYYNLSVSRMLVVSCYPNDSGRPFVDDVPVMEWETERLMSFQRMRVACRAT
jgi:ATP-dependent exoDNAse (exonuclease V) beta subunit